MKERERSPGLSKLVDGLQALGSSVSVLNVIFISNYASLILIGLCVG